MLGRALLFQNRLYEAGQFLKRALVEMENKYEENDPRMVPALDLLSLFYWRNGQYSKAEEIATRALESLRARDSLASPVYASVLA
jgi:tetratricopeptide (TPR) repeat protein